MRAPWRAACVGWLLVVSAGAAQAQGVHPLDTTASPRQQVPALRVLDESGRPLGSNPFAQQAHAYFGRVEYRLATAAFVGQRARIALVLPAQARGLRRAAGLLFHWNGLDGTQSGEARPGQRQVIWSGMVEQAFTTLAIDLGMQLDLSATDAAGGLVGIEPRFELELLP
ncbi:MAG: hypothetical protein KGZ67_08800 [Hydrogenophaga sp.]|nr:hypothetical protein [Hydrogenophaga sp.]